MNQKILVLIISTFLIGTMTLKGQNNNEPCQKNISILTVDNEGDGDFLTIQTALNNAVEHDIIHIYSGTYQECIEINTANIQIIGFNFELGTGNDTDYPIIDGHTKGNVIHIYADNITIKHCIIINSGSDIFDAGIAIFSNENTIEENGIIGNRYGIILNNCSKNTIQNNLIIANKMDGIFLIYTTDNKIIGNKIKENEFQGIYLFDAYYNNIEQNIIYLNGKDGIQLRDLCQYNTIYQNTIHSNNIDGIKIMRNDVTDNKIKKNTIYSNSWNGIHVMDGSYNEFSENKITLNHFNGFHLGETHNNLIVRNTIQDNQEEGILILFSNAQQNKIYYNNIINDNVYDNGQNKWDNGDLGGNYWSYYTGSDDDNNGIGETAYTIPGSGNTDRYPLMFQQFPPKIPARPQGSTLGIIETYYTYTTSSTDSPYNTIQYGWDWNGDDQVDEWTDFYQPDDPCSIDHLWSDEGKYEIKVKAMDNFGFQSNWSETLSISMPKNKDHDPFLWFNFLKRYFPLFYDFISLFIKINNV